MQNLNLLERKPPSGLSSPRIRQAALASVLVVTASTTAYLIQNRELRNLRHELDRVQAQTEHLNRSIAEVPSPDLAMNDQLAKEESEVQSLESVAHTLSTGGLAHTTGFVSTLRAFGHTSTEGVWLTGIVLDNRRGSMVVEGRALDASRVPALLMSLKAEPYFAGTAFSAIEMTAGAADSPTPADRALRFRVSTPKADVDEHAPGGTAANSAGASTSTAPGSS